MKIELHVRSIQSRVINTFKLPNVGAYTRSSIGRRIAPRFLCQHGELSLVSSPTLFHEFIEAQRKSLWHFLAENPWTAVYPVILPVTWASLILLKSYRFVNVNNKIIEQPVFERGSSSVYIIHSFAVYSKSGNFRLVYFLPY